MPADLQSLPILVDTPERFASLLDDLRHQSQIGVDTESNSLHAYHERVCLVQFSTPDDDYVLDPLAINDLSPLGAIFSSASIEKIFHAAEYDIICLQRDYHFEFAHLFDTMQAGRILGRRQAGLDRLLEEKFAVKVNKRFQKADWAVRPLSRDLLMYARLDTHYLIPLHEMLKAELEQHKLWQLAQEDFRLACRTNGSKPKVEVPAWTRYSSRKDLTVRDLTILDSLLRWREGVASALDRPPFKVLDDDRLLAIAAARPSTPAELDAIGLTSRQMQQWGPTILEAVIQGVKGPLVRRNKPPRPDEIYLRRLDKLKEWRKKAAGGMDVESDVVLPRPFLLELAAKGPDEVRSVLQASPWRLEHYGEQIQKVLGG